MSRKDFYQSKIWRKQARYIWLKQNCLCAKCNRPVYIDGISDYISRDKRVYGIVHHKEHLNELNYLDENISLNEDNLVGLCIYCHNEAHSNFPIREGLMFDDMGNLINKN